MGKKFLFFILCIAPCLNEAIGQNALTDTTELEEVSISVMPFRDKYLDATAGVFTVRGDEIRRENAPVSAALFNIVPGVFMASGALNTHRIVIRGVGSRTPYGSNRIRAYLDDIPLTSGDGISTLEDMDLLAIGNMEVLKGPSSALYGSGLGGVIRLNSPYPEMAGWETSLMAEAGSFGHRRYALTGNLKKGELALSGGFSRTASEGFRENSQYLRHSAFLHANRFWNKHRLSLTLSLIDLRSGIPSSLSEEDFMNEPEKAGGSWGIIKGFEEYIKLLGGLKLESKLGAKLSNQVVVHGNYSDPYERRPFNILEERSSSLGLRDFLEYKLESVKVGAGLEYFFEDFLWRTYETLPEAQGDLLSDQSEIRKYLNTFTYVQWRPSPFILLDAGLNLNILSYSLNTHYRIDSTEQSGSYRYKPVLSPRIGISFKHGKHIRSYASAGHGFSAPSLEETLLPEGSVNTSLRPEQGWNMELGNRGILLDGRLIYDLSLYAIFLDDLLVTERLSEDVFTGVNAGSAWNRGLEFMLRGKLYKEQDELDRNAGFSLSYHLSRNTFRDFVDDGIDYSGMELPGIPLQILRAELNGTYRGLSLRLFQNYTGPQWMNDANDLKYSAYALTDLQLGWEFNPDSLPFRLVLYAGIKNLFDTHYASMILINAPSFGGRPPRYYYPGTPRHFYMGIRLSIHSPS
jgi:iron complex outermembrane receptor protein